MRVTVVNTNNDKVMELDYTITSLKAYKGGVYEYNTNVDNHLLYSQYEFENGTELEPFEKLENLMIAMIGGKNYENMEKNRIGRYCFRYCR